MKIMCLDLIAAAVISILLLSYIQYSVGNSSTNSVVFTKLTTTAAATCNDPTTTNPCVHVYSSNNNENNNNNNLGRQPSIIPSILPLCGGQTTKEPPFPPLTIDAQPTETNSTTTTVEQDYIASLTFPLHPSPTDPDGIPHRYLLMAKHNRPHALQAYQSTLAWRRDYNVDTILSRPHTKYDQVKAIFPHYFPGRDVHGNIVFVQRVGQIQLDLKHALHVSNDDMYHHLIYVLEYCWNILHPDNDHCSSSDSEPKHAVMTSVLDFTGVSFSTLQNSEIMSFVKHVISTMSHHYPSRSYKTLLINAPRWFGALYNIIKPLLRESTRQKIEIHSGGSKQDEALRRILGEECLPLELLSTNPNNNKKKKEGETTAHVSTLTEPGPNSVQEQQLREFCVRNMERSGEKMLPVS